MKFVAILLIVINVAAFLINIADAAVKAYQKRLELEMKAEMMEKYKKDYLDYNVKRHFLITGDDAVTAN